MLKSLPLLFILVGGSLFLVGITWLLLTSDTAPPTDYSATFDTLQQALRQEATALDEQKAAYTRWGEELKRRDALLTAWSEELKKKAALMEQ